MKFIFGLLSKAERERVTKAIAEELIKVASDGTEPKAIVKSVNEGITTLTDGVPTQLQKGEPFDKEITYLETRKDIEYQDGTETRKQLGDGVDAILMIPVGKEAEEIIAYKFDASQFTDDQAAAWMKDHFIADFAKEGKEPTQKSDAPVVEPITKQDVIDALKETHADLFVQGMKDAELVTKQDIEDAIQPLSQRLQDLEKMTKGSNQLDTEESTEKKEHSGTAFLGAAVNQ